MDIGTFLGKYESKLKEFETLINQEQDSYKKKQLEENMYEYMAECLPYIKLHTDDETTVESEVDNIFNITITKGIQRKEIYYEYLRNVENFKGSLCVDKNSLKIDKYGCEMCGSNNVFMDHVHSEVVCEECGVCSYFVNQELTYKEEQENCEKVTNNSYKRDNHLNEWILQFQGREMTTIPSSVIEQLRSEFKKQKIESVKEITQKKVKGLLRKLKLSKYYEHATYITNMLNGLDPPVMSHELEEKIRQMFREIQEPFEKHCPINRSNFLSYSYVLYKFCELLSEDQYLPYFPLLKSKEKLRQQDVIWKNICNELKWQYLPTC